MSGMWGPDADRAWSELNRSWEKFAIKITLSSAAAFFMLGFFAGWWLT